jgi:hypothetical protein
MRQAFRIGVAISSILIVLGATVAPSQAAAPKPGTACKTLGQKIVSGKLTYTCSQSGSRLIWSKGYKLPLRVITKTLPVAISGKAYRAVIEVMGGTGYHFCNLQKGSGLPPGYSLKPKTCVITGIGEILPSGTTQRVSPPFVIIVTDSASPKPATIRMTTSIVTYPPAPEITVLKGTCYVEVNCGSLVATATGGTLPYTFSNGSGFPPMGLFVMSQTDGAYLSGVARTPTSNPAPFQVCVTDVVDRQACKTATVDVLPAPIFIVTVTKAGDGQGAVLTNYGPINCGATCQGKYAIGSELTLTANPIAGSVFTGWAGDCTGTGSCTLKIDGNTNVKATFTLNASGTYSGTAVIPNLNVTGFTGCEASTRTMSLTIVESEGGKITGKSTIPFTGTRVGNAITVTASTTYGLRGPFVWQWDGTNLTGSLPWFCYHLDTNELVNESTYTFTYKKY